MSANPTVAVRALEKTYRLSRHGDEIGLSCIQKKIVVNALKPASFVTYAGESIGVLGKNGSGKSTLMSLIAGNIPPSGGSVLVSDQPTLLSVSAALQSHLSGSDNVRLGLLAKGLSLSETKSIEKEVAEWADIGEAIHRPLKTYSSGMKARLRFSIATAVHPGILLIDEALATGDATFNSRAKEKMNAFLNDAATVFLVSHSIGSIRSQCTRALWLHQGEIISDGSTNDVTSVYQAWSRLIADGKKKDADALIEEVRDSYVAPKIVFDSEAIRFLN